MNRYKNLTPIKNLHHLDLLTLNILKGEPDFSALSGCYTLTGLKLDETGVRDLSWVKSLNQLAVLSLPNNNIIDIFCAGKFKKADIAGS